MENVSEVHPRKGQKPNLARIAELLLTTMLLSALEATPNCAIGRLNPSAQKSPKSPLHYMAGEPKWKIAIWRIWRCCKILHYIVWSRLQRLPSNSQPTEQRYILILIGAINPPHSNCSVNATDYETGKNESDSNIPPPLRLMLQEKFYRKPTDPTWIARATARQTAPDQIYQGTRVPVPQEMRRRGRPWGREPANEPDGSAIPCERSAPWLMRQDRR
jgi:hypothetical protein